MHDNDVPSIKWKPICKNHNELDIIIHLLVPRKNEGEQLRNMWNWEIGWYVY
jgi:hypothetical protein